MVLHCDEIGNTGSSMNRYRYGSQVSDIVLARRAHPVGGSPWGWQALDRII